MKQVFISFNFFFAVPIFECKQVSITIPKQRSYYFWFLLFWYFELGNLIETSWNLSATRWKNRDLFLVCTRHVRNESTSVRKRWPAATITEIEWRLHRPIEIDIRVILHTSKVNALTDRPLAKHLLRSRDRRMVFAKINEETTKKRTDLKNRPGLQKLPQFKKNYPATFLTPSFSWGVEVNWGNGVKSERKKWTEGGAKRRSKSRATFSNPGWLFAELPRRQATEVTASSRAIRR